MMLRPVEKRFRITQTFGERPDAYARFGLLGHNGLDFGVPVGTPVVAVDAGTVVEAADDPGGYGLYIKLKHALGESLYAHLSRRVVTVGGTIARGGLVGLSGNTGNSTGPHLHFAVRIKPYFRDDGWNGYSDPLPHLERSERSVLGPHLAGPQVGHMVDMIGKWKPAYALYLDPNRDAVQAIKQASPGTRVVGRIFRADSEVADQINANSVEAAHWMDNLVRGHPAYRLCDYWQIANEVCQVDWTEFGKLCHTMRQWMKLARTDYRCAIFAFSVGQPDLPENDRMAFWRATISALEQAILGDHILLIHQYGMPDLWGPDSDWYINRFEHQVLPRLGYLDKERSAAARAAVPTLKAIEVVCSEYGIDGLIRGERKGWRSYTTADGYAEQLRNMASYVERYPQVGGYCIYTTGHASSDWEDYDIWPEVVERLAQEPGPGPGPQPPDPIDPPGGGKMRLGKGAGPSGMDLKVIPFRERADWKESAMKPDSLVWQIKDVWTTHNGSWEVDASQRFGIDQWARDEYLRSPSDPLYNDDAGADHHILACALDKQGRPYLGAGFAITSDGPQWLQPPHDPNHIAALTGKTTHGWGNQPMSGPCDPPTAPGPFSLVKLSEVGASDIISGMGMPWNWHVSFFVVYQATRWDQLQVAPVFASLQEALLWHGAKAQVIQFNPNASLQKRIFADGFVPNSPEFEVEFGGVRYVAQRAEHLATGVVRMYYCPRGVWEPVLFVVKPAA